MTLTELRVELEYHHDNPLMREVRKHIEALRTELADTKKQILDELPTLEKLQERFAEVIVERDTLRTRLAEIEASYKMALDANEGLAELAKGLEMRLEEKQSLVMIQRNELVSRELKMEQLQTRLAEVEKDAAAAVAAEREACARLCEDETEDVPLTLMANAIRDRSNE